MANCCNCKHMIHLIGKISKKIIEDYIKDNPITTGTLKGIQAQLQGDGSYLNIDTDSIFPFNTIVNTTSEIILVDGVFTVPKTGNYLVNWQTYVNGGTVSNKISLAIAVNGQPQSYANIIGQLNSSVFLTLSAGDTITLLNTSGQSISLASLGETIVPVPDIRANITITFID